MDYCLRLHSEQLTRWTCRVDCRIVIRPDHRHLARYQGYRRNDYVRREAISVPSRRDQRALPFRRVIPRRSSKQLRVCSAAPSLPVGQLCVRHDPVSRSRIPRPARSPDRDLLRIRVGSGLTARLHRGLDSGTKDLRLRPRLSRGLLGKRMDWCLARIWSRQRGRVR